MAKQHSTRDESASNPVDDKTVAIMRAITRCIERQGLKKTRMDDIAAEANLSRITLYREYGNRDSLINAFLAFRSANFNSRIKSKLDACKTIDDALECYLVDAALIAATDTSIRELVIVHQIFQSALNDDDSPLKSGLRELWVPLVKKLCATDAKVHSLPPDDIVDWLLIVQSYLVIIVIESAWSEQKLRALVRNFISPAFSTPTRRD